MRRLVTLAIGACLAALVAVAAVDTLRDSPELQVGESEPALTLTEPPPSPSDWLATARRSRRTWHGSASRERST